MPKLSTSVRVAASSILSLSVLHTLFWGYIALSLRTQLLHEFPYNYIFPIVILFAAIGLLGILVSLGLFYGSNWARIAMLALASLVAFFCMVAMSAIIALFFISGSTAKLTLGRNDLLHIFVIYVLILLIALWWIILFSRQKVAAQFSSNANAPQASEKKPSCPPPIALLAWLMIASGTLSALFWPLMLGKIPAMLFTHIFSAQSSHWIWAVNIVLFLACGIGLLKLQSWSYTATIALHVFWLASLFVTQLSPLYNRYISMCLSALSAPSSYMLLGINHLPQWAAALFSAIPTALLIVGLFYYRPAFLKSVADSRHQS